MERVVLLMQRHCIYWDVMKVISVKGRLTFYKSRSFQLALYPQQ